MVWQLRAPLERDSILRQQARVLRGRTLPLILRRRENHQTKDVIKQILARLLAVESCWPCVSVVVRRSHTVDARLTPFPALTLPFVRPGGGDRDAHRARHSPRLPSLRLAPPHLRAPQARPGTLRRNDGRWLSPVS